MSYIKQFRIISSSDFSVANAIEEANDYGKNNKAEIVSIATISGIGVKDWKLLVVYKEL